jgi:hypothetical protein
MNQSLCIRWIKIKMFIILFLTRNIEELIREILDDWNRKEISEHWKKIARYGNLFYNVCNLVYSCAFFIFILDTMLSYLNTHDKDRRFIMDVHYSFNYKSSPYYEIIAIIQICQAISVCSIDSLSKNLLIICVRTINSMLYKN